MKHYDIIRKPVLSEKSYSEIANKKYVFEVAVDANKIEIKEAIEAVFGVKVEKVNKRAKFQAFKSAISYKAQNNEIIVVDKIELPEIKTKYVQQILNNFKLDKKVLLVLPEYNEVLLRAGRNIEKLAISTVELVSLYEVVSNATILMTSEAIKNMEEAFAE